MIQSKLISSNLLANYIIQHRFTCNCIGRAVKVTFYTECIYLKIKRKWKFTLISSNISNLIDIDVNRSTTLKYRFLAYVTRFRWVLFTNNDSHCERLLQGKRSTTANEIDNL
jgi:hypothetical protein